MSPYTEGAMKNLRRGIKKMAKAMSPAAQVRRDFRLGRPPKPGDSLPLHPAVVWQKSNEAVSNFRARMSAAKLDPKHVAGAIVYIELANPDVPHLLFLEDEQKTPDELRAEVFQQLSREDAIALGMIFRQFDTESKKQVDFPYQFTGLNERGIAVLKSAATSQANATALLKNIH